MSQGTHQQAHGGATSTSLPVLTYTQTQVFEASRECLDTHHVLAPESDEPAAAAIRILRTQVLQRMHERGLQTLAVVSPAPREGKTTLAANLAVAIAADHHHTALLVDLDLRSPGVARSFGLVPQAGVDDVLAERAGVEQALYHPSSYERLVLMPVREPVQRSSEMLTAARARALIAELRARYPDRIILFDLPPLLARDDAAAFMPLVDCALLVVSEGTTRRDDVTPAMALLRNTPLVGAVLNRASDSRAGYG